jgi:small-conductance mechanosensitive channel
VVGEIMILYIFAMEVFNQMSLSEFWGSLSIIGLELFYMVIVLVIGWVIGRVVAFLVNRIVDRFGWDSMLRKTSLGRAILRSGYTAGSFIASLVKWIIYLVAILAALTIPNIPLLRVSAEWVISFLPSFVKGLLILIIGIILIDWFADSIKKGQIEDPIIVLTSDVIRIFLYLIVIAMALSNMGVDVTAIYIIITPVAWAMAIAIGIAAGIMIVLFFKDRILKSIKDFIEKAGKSESED